MSHREQESGISSLSDGSTDNSPLEAKLPCPPPSQQPPSISPFSSGRISSSNSSSDTSHVRSSKAFKDLHEYLSDGTESNVKLHSLFSDKPTFFASPVNRTSNGRSSRQFSLADSTTSSTVGASPKAKNKRTLDDVESEDRALIVPLKIFGEADQVVDESTRQRLYAENLKIIEQFLGGSSTDGNSSAAPPPPPAPTAVVSTSSTTDQPQQQPSCPVMMDVDLPLR